MRRCAARLLCRPAYLKPSVAHLYRVSRRAYLTGASENPNDQDVASMLAGSVLVSQVLKSKAKGLETLLTVAPTETLYSAGKIMVDKGIGSILVTSPEDGRCLGILTERDYLKQTLAKGDAKTVKVGDVMTPVDKMVTVDSKDKLDKCMQLMSTKKIRHLPVFENGGLYGILSIKDVLESIVESNKTQVERLQNFIRTWIRNRVQVAKKS